MFVEIKTYETYVKELRNGKRMLVVEAYDAFEHNKYIELKTMHFNEHDEQLFIDAATNGHTLRVYTNKDGWMTAPSGNRKGIYTYK